MRSKHKKIVILLLSITILSIVSTSPISANVRFENRTIQHGGEIGIIGEVENDVEIDNWSWEIIDESYNSDEIIEEAKLKNPESRNPKLKAPILTTDSLEESLVIEVKGVGEEEYSDTGTITLKNTPIAKTGGPYDIIEGEEKTITAENSIGVDLNYFWKSADPNIIEIEEEGYEAQISASFVEEKEESSIYLELSDERGYTDTDNIQVNIIPAKIEAEIKTSEIYAGETKELESEIGGDFEDINWEIINDPSDNSKLINPETTEPELKAPSSPENDFNLELNLTVSTYGRENVVSENILVKTRTPKEPENLKVNNTESPQNLDDLSPEFSAIYEHENPKSPAKEMEVIIKKESMKENWKLEESPEITSGERASAEFEPKILVPGEEYEWKIRFTDNSGSGPWTEGQFETEELLDLPHEEAERFLDPFGSLNIERSQRAKVLEEALEENRESTMEIIESLSYQELVNLSVDLTNTIDSPESAAKILNSVPEEVAIDTVFTLGVQERYEVLDNIFMQEEISEERLDLVYESLPGEDDPQFNRNMKKEFEEELSEEAIERIPTLAGGIWSTVAIIILVIFLVILLSFYRKKAKEKSRNDIWNKAVGRFISSGKRKVGIKSNLPPQKEASRAKKAIERLNVKERVRVAKDGNKIVLERKR